METGGRPLVRRLTCGYDAALPAAEIAMLPKRYGVACPHCQHDFVYVENDIQPLVRKNRGGGTTWVVTCPACQKRIAIDPPEERDGR